MKRKKQSFEDGAQHGLVSAQPLALPPSSLVLGMLQVMGTSLTAAQAVARVVSSLGEKPTKAKSPWAQARLVLHDGGPVGWQDAGGGSKVTVRAWQWKASSVGVRQFCHRFQQSWDFCAGGTAQRITLPSYMSSVALGDGCPSPVWSKNFGTGDSRQSTEPW